MTHKGPILALALLGVLGACATPLEQCLYAATSDQRAIERELGERQVALSRGFSVEYRRVPSWARGLCPGPGGTQVTCMRPDYDVEEIHHRVNPEVERERIALLERQLERETRRAAEAQGQCRATYPEG